MLICTGAIQLALNVAGRSDKANIALSWIMDGRPEQVLIPACYACTAADDLQDPRKEYFYFRKQCYDLISKVVLAVDNLAASDPGFIDGQLTIIAKRQNEAYGVIADSTDEVFLTSLYDWYLEQGWKDRLLQEQSPFVVTYLERKSTDDIAHADLLWNYYAKSKRFFEAAKVQFQLAQSAFTLPLSRRIEYLGNARANASAFTQDVGRQSRQRLLQDISNLIDVANIQDDLLQRLKDDPRIAPDRKAEVLRDVDGPVMDISTVRYLRHSSSPPLSNPSPAFQPIRRLGQLLRHLPADLLSRRLPQRSRYQIDLATLDPRSARRHRGERHIPPRSRNRQGPESGQPAAPVRDRLPDPRASPPTGTVLARAPAIPQFTTLGDRSLPDPGRPSRIAVRRAGSNLLQRRSPLPRLEPAHHRRRPGLPVGSVAGGEFPAWRDRVWIGGDGGAGVGGVVVGAGWWGFAGCGG